MLSVLIALVVVAVLVNMGEFLRSKFNLRTEITRKFIHITVASFAATWPLFMSWQNVELMSLLMFAGVLVSKHLSYFHSIHDVKRLTWGEVFFPISIGLCALISNSAWIFAAAMLHLGLADGLAAVVGTLFGQRQYKVLGHRKTTAGTITFGVMSFIIIAICGVANGPHEGFAALVWMPAFATLLETIGIAGTDNLLVPLFIAIML